MSVQEHAITALGAALEGSRVAFFVASLSDARMAFDAVAAIAPESCVVRRTNGAESVRTPAGGSVQFVSVRSHGHRGLSLDRVYVPAELADEHVAAEIAACLASSKNPMFIGYL
ncbi:hypothetical protein ABC337_04970 [Arthrobacter sp. 1P04PC]|uniref:hypothetical protein n=1 Tax=unclassified Arthrobacter TaxID=235627 RepID=UPI0039A0B609